MLDFNLLLIPPIKTDKMVSTNFTESAEQWLDDLILTEENRYYIYEFNYFGQRRKGYAKLSDDKKYVTIIFHAHKNKWAIIKDSVAALALLKSPKIEREIFEYSLNQNIRNV